SDVDRECATKKKLLAFDVDEADKIILGAFVDLATTKARIDKSSKPHSCEMSRALCCDVAKKVRNHALRKVVRLDLIGNRQLLQFRHQPPMPPDHAAHQTFVSKVIQSPVVAVTLTSGVDQREIARLVGGRSRLIPLRE